jgi:hypothetical protein
MADTNNNSDTQGVSDQCIPSTSKICLFPLFELYSAVKICILFMARLETIIGLALTLGATIILYYCTNISHVSHSKGTNLNLPWMVLSYTHIITLSQLVRMRFRRREYVGYRNIHDFDCNVTRRDLLMQTFAMDFPTPLSPYHSFSFP